MASALGERYMLSKQSAAEFLDVSVGTIKQLIADGKLTTYPISDRRVGLKTAELRAYADSLKPRTARGRAAVLQSMLNPQSKRTGRHNA